MICRSFDEGMGLMVDGCLVDEVVIIVEGEMLIRFRWWL